MLNCIYRCLSIFLLITGISCQNIQVEIPQGTLSGATRQNVEDGTFYIFKNIPYGKPPVGELRFKATELADGWDGVRDATQDAAQCNSAEDCLYLNIYTPGLPAENVTGLPVLFRIHGGGFEGGGSGEMNYGGGFLMTKDIVFVSINYRLGLLGFISLDDPNLGLTGNAALKDQVLALQWVQQNIEYFGGDPNNVVVSGESAGSMCTHYHVLSSASSGLFHKAISESGSAFTPDAIAHIRNSAVIVAEYLGIQTDDWEAMVTSLQEVTLGELSSVQTTLKSVYPYLFRPIVEISTAESVFLDRWPIDIIQSGDFNQVPYLNGVNNMDGMGPVSNIADFIPPDLGIESGSEAEQDIIQRIEDFYYGEGVSWGDLSADAVLDTDYQFLYPHYRAVTGQVQTATQPIFLYYFTAVTGLNSGPPGGQGAAHGAHLGYLFYNTQNSQNSIEAGSVEDLAWRNMVDLWTNFMIYGNPTPEGFDYTWINFENDQHNYLEIATSGSYPSVELLQANMDFWDQIYADYYPGN